MIFLHSSPNNLQNPFIQGNMAKYRTIELPENYQVLLFGTVLAFINKQKKNKHLTTNAAAIALSRCTQT